MNEFDRDRRDLALLAISIAVVSLCAGVWEFRHEVGRFFRAFPEASLAVVLVCMAGIGVAIVTSALRRREP